MRRVRLAAAAGSAALLLWAASALLGAAGCSSFGEGSNTTADASTPDGDGAAAALDAGVGPSDGGTFCTTQDAALCDDFDGLGFAKSWSAIDTTLTIDHDPLPGSQLIIRSPALTAQTADVSKSLAKTFAIPPTAFTLTVDLDVYAEEGLFTCGYNGPEVVTVALDPDEVHLTLEQKHLFMSEFVGDIYKSGSNGAPNLEMAKSTHAMITVHFPPSGANLVTADLEVDGNLATPFPRKLKRGNATALTVKVGIPHLHSPAQATVYRIDDVVMRMLP